MQAKSTYIAFSLLLTCCLALSLASCQNSSWHLAASKKGGTVDLCLSNGDECPPASGVSREVKILELAETMSDGLPAPNGLGTTLLPNSGPCNVVLRPFRIFPCANALSG